MAFRAPEYERFEGELARMPPWWPLWRATFRRGWRSKWIRWLTFASFFPAIGFSIALYVANEIFPGWREALEEAGEQFRGRGPDLTLDGRAYLALLQGMYLYPVLMPMSLLLGYDLLAGDMRSNALEAYFSRPITPWGYVFGRTVAFTAYLLAISLLPMLWIWGLDVLTAPPEHYEKVKDVPLGLAASLGLVAVMMALFVQAVTSLTRSGLWTTLVLAVIFIVSSALGPILYELTGNASLMAAAFWQNIYVVCNGFLGYPESTAGHSDFALSFGIMLAILGGSLFYLLRRVKRRGLVG